MQSVMLLINWKAQSPIVSAVAGNPQMVTKLSHLRLLLQYINNYRFLFVIYF